MISRPNFIVILLIISLFLFSSCDVIKGIYSGSEEEAGLTYVAPETIKVEVGVPSGKVIIDSLDKQVTLSIANLAVPDSEHAYEAWLFSLETNYLTSIGTFDVDENGNAEVTKELSAEIISNVSRAVISLEQVPDKDDKISEIIVMEGQVEGTADVVEIILEPTGDFIKKPIKEEPQEAEIVVVEETGKPQEEEAKEEKPTEISKEEKAIVIIIQETEPVNLRPKAYDPDKDKLTFSYTTPLSSDGKWQTTYGDAGEYTVTVTASDGLLSTSKDVLIIVNRKEEPPEIKSFAPESLTPTAKENTELEFSVEASDVNKDKLSYKWNFDGNAVSDKNKFTYEISYDDAGEHKIKVIVSDGTLETEKEWQLTVENVNRIPILDKVEDVVLKETETVILTTNAVDPDGDDVTITMSDPVGDDGKWETTYDDAGEYTITITASDGTDETSQKIKITVENVNRAPVIEEIINE